MCLREFATQIIVVLYALMWYSEKPTAGGGYPGGASYSGRSTGTRIRFEYIVFARARLSRVSMELFLMISVAELNIRSLYTSMITWSQLRMIVGAYGRRVQTPYSLVAAAVFTCVLGY